MMGETIKSSITSDNCFSRCIGGEPCCNNVYTNGGSEATHVTLSPNFPAKVGLAQNLLLPRNLSPSRNLSRARNLSPSRNLPTSYCTPTYWEKRSVN